MVHERIKVFSWLFDCLPNSIIQTKENYYRGHSAKYLNIWFQKYHLSFKSDYVQCIASTSIFSFIFSNVFETFEVKAGYDHSHNIKYFYCL